LVPEVSERKGIAMSISSQINEVVEHIERALNLLEEMEMNERINPSRQELRQELYDIQSQLRFALQILEPGRRPALSIAEALRLTEVG
jgi:hypothetical protein